MLPIPPFTGTISTTIDIAIVPNYNPYNRIYIIPLSTTTNSPTGQLVTYTPVN